MLRRLLKRWGSFDTLFVPVVIVILVVYLATSSPVFLSIGNISNVLSQMVLLALVAFGGTFVILVAEIDLSVGAGAAFVSVVAAFVILQSQSVALGLAVGALAGIGIGLVNGLIVTRLEVPSFITTLGMMVILRGLALSLTNGGVVAGLPDSFQAVANGVITGLPYMVWLTGITFVVLYLVQSQTNFGIRVFAVGDNREAARLSGIPVATIRLFCFLISGCTMGLAGLSLLIRVESGQPNGANLLELYAIAAIVMGGTSLLGGRGSIIRTLFGVLLITILENGLDLNGVSFDTQQTVIGVVFILAASVDFVRRHLQSWPSRKMFSVTQDVALDDVSVSTTAAASQSSMPPSNR